VTLHPREQARYFRSGEVPGKLPGHPEENQEEEESPMETTTDSVCGMAIDVSAAAGSATYAGRTYRFCSSACQQRFEADPAQYVKQDA
jgi:Cu+-exporting ATPase